MRPGPAARGPQRGVALLEWMLAHSLGLVVVAAAMSLFLHQARVAMALHQRQLQLQDLGVVAQVLRAELRIAGHRLQPVLHPGYDQLQVDSGSNPAIHYLCDACEASDPTRPAGFRLQSGTLMQRAQSAGSFQAVHDTPTSGWRSWAVATGVAEGCVPHVTVALQPIRPGLGPTTVRVRPRNGGPLACETMASPVVPVPEPVRVP